MDHDHPAYRYAAWAAEHTDQAPVYVRRQAESWMNIADGMDPEAEVDDFAVQKNDRLLKIIRHPDLKCPVYDGLEPYAWLLITATMCTKLRSMRLKPDWWMQQNITSESGDYEVAHIRLALSCSGYLPGDSLTAIFT